MPASDRIEIAVVGAGVVGLATALRLAAEGREVMLIDPNEP
ncbi:MAG: FAD-dependent oxidoreductase, partial [Mesorhizobium sp.]